MEFCEVFKFVQFVADPNINPDIENLNVVL